MQKYLIFLVFLLYLLGMTTAECPKEHPAPQAYDGWRMGVQTWTFNRFTLFEAIDKTQTLGLSYIQAYPGQQVSKEINVPFNRDLSPENRAKVKAKLNEAGLRIFAYGVVGVPKDEAGARKLFEFAKDMGVETIASEPDFDQFDLIEKLCKEYQIKLGIHNHPKPTKYWNPATVLKACEGRSQWIGACTDVGHWVRSGLNPVDCLKDLEGRIQDVHIKEIDDNHDVVWGTGQGRMEGILKELHAQDYKGTFSIEYEYNWDNNVPEVRDSIAYFDSVASQLKPTGWKPVFTNDLSNASFAPNSWVMEEGELIRKDQGDIWTQQEYGDFILDFEFYLDKGSNSGIFLRAKEHVWLPWVEVQVADSFGSPINKHICGGIYDIKEPSVNAVKEPGQWNRMTIQGKGPMICVLMNHQPVIDINLDHWTEAHKNPDGTNNKFDIAYKDLPRTGWIGFQDHGFPIRYRNVRIKEL